jgi:steroid delta-isomerase-like uncharacterized protein
MVLNRMRLTILIALVAAACLALPFVGASGDFTPHDQASDARKIGQGWCDAWNSPDVNRFPAAFTDDLFYEDVTNGFTSHGTTAVWEYGRSFFALIPDFHFDCTATFVSDGHGSIEWVASGTDVGLYKTGEHFAVRGASVIDVRDGKIARSIDYYDDSTIRRQVGLLSDMG